MMQAQVRVGTEVLESAIKMNYASFGFEEVSFQTGRPLNKGRCLKEVQSAILKAFLLPKHAEQGRAGSVERPCIVGNYLYFKAYKT